MPSAREAPEMRELILARFEERELQRRPGIHASDLDMCLGKAFYRKTARLPTPADLMFRFMLGFALQFYILGVPEEEMECEGVLMSVDAPVDGSYLEFKSTAEWFQTAKWGTYTPLKKSHWMRRAMMYCHARGVDFCYIAVMFYSQRPKPDLVVWRVEFTGLEIADNWGLTLTKKASLEKALKELRYPDNDYHEEWECGMCENNIPGRCYGRGPAPDYDKWQ